MLENTPLADAFNLAEAIRHHFSQHAFFEQQEHVYLCAGVATMRINDHDITDIYRRSDQALYQAKRSGRNRCCVYNPSIR